MDSLFLPAALIVAITGIALTAAADLYDWRGAASIASIAWVVAFGSLTCAVAIRGFEVGGLPLSSRGEYLLFLGWAVLAVHLFVWFRLRVDLVGLILPSVSVLSVVLAWNLQSAAGSRPASSTPPGWLVFHTTISTLGIATLCLAFAMSLLYLAQDRALKRRKNWSLIERLPSLERCDQVGLQAMWIGFILLTLGIATGVVVNTSEHSRLLVPGAKQTIALLTWLVFAALLASRRWFGFRGRKSAYVTIVGFALGLATVLGMTLR